MDLGSSRIRPWIVALFLLFALGVLASAGGLIRLSTDWRWFNEVGFAAGFATVLKSQVALG